MTSLRPMLEHREGIIYPSAKFNHLLSLVGPHGVFEHADHHVAREEHGYCVDDMARVLLVAAREREPSEQVVRLAEMALEFLDDAQSPEGTFQNRRDSSGVFFGAATNEDCWGRAVWALGSAVTLLNDEGLVDLAYAIYERALRVRSPWPRSMAFATLGASEVLAINESHESSRSLLRDAQTLLDRPTIAPSWHWPEDSLRYANAILPEALLAIASVFDDERLLNDGLEQLSWLLELETCSGYLSVTSSKGRQREIRHEGFDQQPIEVAALCDACARAFVITNEPRWLRGVELCVQWFTGANEVGTVMFNPTTGGGYDGLTPRGPNLNQGAESTLAMIATLQYVGQLQYVS